MATERKLAAAEFKARCLQVMDEVQTTGIPVTLTKRGKPVARLVPIEPPADSFGRMKGSIVIHGDLVEGTGEFWEADA